MKKNLRRLLFGLFAAMFLISGGLLARDLIRSRRERRANEELAQQVHQARKELGIMDHSGMEALQSPYAESGVLRQYDPLWQQNNDLCGWLWIDDTDIDYPVMYTPDNPEKYLHRDFHGGWAASGSLFIGQYSSPDAPLVIVYGHHMKDGTMFSGLDRYQSEDYFREHPIIHLDTLTEEREYEVIAAFQSRVYEAGETGVFRYYQYSDLSDPESFDQYISQAKAASIYDTGVEVSFGDRILVLSTCSYHTENGRFAVVARQAAKDGIN